MYVKWFVYFKLNDLPPDSPELPPVTEEKAITLLIGLTLF